MSRQLTKHFNEDEFRCNCASKGLDVDDSWCHGMVWVHQQVVDYLQVMRHRLNRPIHINSGCRCPAYNAHIGGARMSQHKLGTAADIWAEGVTPEEMARLASEVGFRGIGIYDTKNFTHVDIRHNGVTWRG